MPSLYQDLRAEYDLKNIRVRKLGSGRKSFDGVSVRLESDKEGETSENQPRTDNIVRGVGSGIGNSSGGPDAHQGKLLHYPDPMIPG